jgi:transposase InsO family protein
VLAIMAVDTRRIVHVAVTRHPTLDWVKQQIREATPFGTVPRFLIHDNDGIFGQLGRCAFPRPRTPGRSFRCTLDAWLDGALGIEGLPIPFGAPNANPHIERFWRTLREECLQRFIFLSEGHLRRTVRSYVRYYNGARVHQGIEGIPEPEPGALAPPDCPGDASRVDSRPVLGGLIHDYRLAA